MSGLSDRAVRSVVSKHNQYSVGSKSACSVIAAEMSLALLHPSTTLSEEDLLDKVLLNCSNIECDHLDVQDVLKDCRRFNLGLRIVDVKQMAMLDLGRELHMFVLGNRTQMPFSVIITKPPETVTLICKSEKEFLFFDSHPRKDSSGAHIKLFNKFLLVQIYIKNLWESVFIDSMSETERLLLNTVQWVVVQPTEMALEDLPSLSEFKAVLEMAKKKDEIIQRQKDQINQLTRELSVCKKEKAETEKYTKLLYEKAKEMANESIRIANGDLNSLEQLKSDATLSTTTTTTAASSMDLDPLVSKFANFLCLLCGKSKSVEFVFRLEATGCNHEMCRECAANYFTREAQGYKFPIRCPSPKCKKIIKEDDFSLVLGEGAILNSIYKNQYLF